MLLLTFSVQYIYVLYAKKTKGKAHKTPPIIIAVSWFIRYFEEARTYMASVFVNYMNLAHLQYTTLD